MQTVMGFYLRALIPKLQYKREVLRLSDGGQVNLDWLDDESSTSDSATKPTVLFLPGLTGNSQAEYLRVLCGQARNLGYRCVVFNNRGTGNSKLLTPRIYCASNCEDLTEVVNHIKSKYPDAPLMGTGISMGSMILFHYLRQMGDKSKMIAAMLISPIWNAHEANKSSEQPVLNIMFNRHLARELIRVVKRNKDLLSAHPDLDFDRIYKCETIRDFDIEVTCKLFNYKHVDDYYYDASLYDKLHFIKTPILAISAGDDMYQPYSAIPLKGIAESSHVATVVTCRGGHIGFLDGLPFLKTTYMERLFTQYVSAVFQHQEELVKCFDETE